MTTVKMIANDFNLAISSLLESEVSELCDLMLDTLVASDGVTFDFPVKLLCLKLADRKVQSASFEVEFADALVKVLAVITKKEMSDGAD